MTVSKQLKSCLIITYGPVPTPQYQTIEGGGMRAWGLAKGLEANGLDVVVGVNAGFPQNIQEHDGIRLVNWQLGDQFAELINSYDAVVISYCMGAESVFVAEHISPDIQLILDAYVPIYIEVSARESEDMDTEYSSYMADIGRFNKVLKRGDYFLCANEAQKTFYTGVLASLGIINPRSYRQERILTVPFGIHDIPAISGQNPYTGLGVKKSDFVVLWFGGLYPWFHVDELLGALKALAKNKSIKFVFVGGKNPFNPNPDFYKQYDQAVSFADSQGLTNKSVFFVDWVDFDKRVDWYAHADLVISLNQPGEENMYSWRTRVMDYVWGELAILTNGGDPLSEDLIKAQAAIRLPELSAEAITAAVTSAYENPSALASIKKAVKSLKPSYYWPSVTKLLASVVSEGELPYKDEHTYKKVLKLGDEPEAVVPNVQRTKLQKAISLPPKMLRYARRKGLLRSAKLGAELARTQLQKRQAAGKQRRYIFISHPLDNTGAPVVLLQIVKEFAIKYGGRNVQLVTPGILPHQQKEMRELGVKVDQAVFGLGFRFIRMQLGLRKNDFVLMNTVAIYDNYRDFIMLWLRNNRLSHAYWFIHEDIAQLPMIHKEFLDPKNIKQIHSLATSEKLTVLVPSKRIKQEYNELLGTKLVQATNLHVEVDEKYHKPRPAADYKTVNFLLQGTPGDGRKGHMIAIAAFNEFLTSYYQKDQSKYREFTLHFVSIADDYISQQVRSIGQTLLGKRLKFYPSMPKAKVLEVYAKCNAVVCCSLNETFALYVAEGMFMGHLVLRNNSAGVDEQLKDGVNGLFIDHTDVKQFAAQIEKILNKKTNSDQQLRDMGQASQKIIKAYSEHSYLLQLTKK